jgi:hypothetical protein
MSCGCPQGYILNNSSGLCERIVQQKAELNDTPVLPAVLCRDPYLNNRGAAVYPATTPSQFPLMGMQETIPKFKDGLGAEISPSDFLVTDFWVSGLSAVHGRFNQAGIGLLPPVGTWQGYASCLSVEEGDVYSVGISATHGFRIYVDGELAVHYKPIPSVLPSSYFHIFPIELEAGTHTILAEGLSGDTGVSRTCFDQYGVSVGCGNNAARTPPSGCPNLGAFVLEIYKNVSAQDLSNVSDQNEINPLYAERFVNSKGQYITTLLLSGMPTDTGANGNYVAGDGYLISCVEGKILYEQTLTAIPGACCFNLVNCDTAAIVVTNTNLQEYIQKTIKIAEYEGCFAIQGNAQVGCPGAVAVTVTDSYDSCQVCTLKYWKLFDCRGQLSPIITTTDLSDHDSKVIQIQGYGACWIVTTWEQSDEARPVIVKTSYETCEECL